MLASARTARTAELLARDEWLLVSNAKTLSFKAFSKTVTHWLQRADPDSADDGDARKVDARSVHHSQSFGGMWFTRGVLDPIRGSIVAKELERLTIAMFEADWAVAKQRLGREPTILELKRTPAQ
ncbi:MAG TPA: hypothetical protein VM143_01910, partial [Acidimicrobiales bacterium]|nr:hypothetical protein [Acidimicrobiales bacterium]